MRALLESWSGPCGRVSGSGSGARALAVVAAMGLVRKKAPLMPMAHSASSSERTSSAMGSRQFQQASPMQHYSARPPRAGGGFQVRGGAGEARAASVVERNRNAGGGSAAD